MRSAPREVLFSVISRSALRASILEKSTSFYFSSIYLFVTIDADIRDTDDVKPQAINGHCRKRNSRRMTVFYVKVIRE